MKEEKKQEHTVVKSVSKTFKKNMIIFIFNFFKLMMMGLTHYLHQPPPVSYNHGNPGNMGFKTSFYILTISFFIRITRQL